MMQHVVFKERNRRNLKKALKSVMQSQKLQPTEDALEVRSPQGINSTKIIPIDHDTLDYDTLDYDTLDYDTLDYDTLDYDALDYDALDYDLEENQFLFRENSGSSTLSSSFVEVKESHKKKLEDELYSLTALIDTLTTSNQEYQEMNKGLILELNLFKFKNQELEEKLVTKQNIIEELNGKNNQFTQEVSDANAVNTELKAQMITTEQRQNQLISFLFEKIKNSFFISTEHKNHTTIRKLFAVSYIIPVMTESEINAKKTEFGLTI